MSNTYKTLAEILVWRIGVTVIATIGIANSVTAQVEFANQESSAISQQSCDDVAQCKFHQSWLGKATNRLPCRARGRRTGGVVAGVKQTAAMLSHRETPLGDMSLHFPYQATHMYYYRRPYNDYHVQRHLDQSKDSPARSSLGENLGYSNQIFEQAHESVEVYLNSEGLELEEDGLLEYADWKQHQQDRLIWESPHRYHADAEGLSLPTEDLALPLEDEEPEEVLNENADNRINFVMSDRSGDEEQVAADPLNFEEGFSVRRLPPTKSP